MSIKKMKNSDNNLQVENNDRVSMKRSLSTSLSNDGDKKRSGSTSKRYRSLLTCVVCNGDAHGYNFDAITCESCKAFFRRNALGPMKKLKCHGDDCCDVGFRIKKRCKKCRLAKCIEQGMRKEWILSDKEREEKRTKIEENRRLRQTYDNNQEREQLAKQDSNSDSDLSLDIFPVINETLLNDFDSFNIQLIKDCYDEGVRLNQTAGIATYPSIQPITSTSELFRIPFYISSMRLISYIKQINEFQQLNADDQVHLVKSNLLVICFFHSIYIYDPRTDSYHEQNTNDPLFSGKDWIKTLNKQFHKEMKQLRNDLIDIFQLDEVVIKLVYLILFFSNQMSLNQSSQCVLTDMNSLNIFKAQNIFTDLLYKYCLHQYGLYQAPILFSKYIHKIMKVQQLVDEMKYTIHNYIKTIQLSPLMQSLLV